MLQLYPCFVVILHFSLSPHPKRPQYQKTSSNWSVISTDTSVLFSYSIRKNSGLRGMSLGPQTNTNILHWTVSKRRTSLMTHSCTKKALCAANFAMSATPDTYDSLFPAVSHNFKLLGSIHLTEGSMKHYTSPGTNKTGNQHRPGHEKSILHTKQYGSEYAMKLMYTNRANRC